MTYLTLVNGVPTLAGAIATSAGAGDAGKIPKTGSDGLIDPTFIGGSSGAFTVGSSGVKIKTDSSALAIRNNADSAYAKAWVNQLGVGSTGSMIAANAATLRAVNSTNTGFVAFQAESFSSNNPATTRTNLELSYRRSWGAGSANLPSTGFAQLGTRASTSNTVELTADFDAATDEFIVLDEPGIQGYGGGNLSVLIRFMMASGTTGNVVWTAAFRRKRASNDAVGDSFASALSVTAAIGGAAAGTYIDAIISGITQAQADSIANGDGYALLIGRDADNGSDTGSGDAQIVLVQVYEG